MTKHKVLFANSQAILTKGKESRRKKQSPENLPGKCI
jgi:hypothetical protein